MTLRRDRDRMTMVNQVLLTYVIRGAILRLCDVGQAGAVHDTGLVCMDIRAVGTAAIAAPRPVIPTHATFGDAKRK